MGFVLCEHGPAEALKLFIGAVIPYAMRSLDALVGKAVAFAVGWFLREVCCLQRRKEYQEIGEERNCHGPTVIEVWEMELEPRSLGESGTPLTWEAARNALGRPQWFVVLVALVRLVFWHWGQPVFYWLVFCAYYSEIDTAQQVLGWFVAVRELIYFLLVCVALWKNPCFLLTDLGETWKSRKDKRTLDAVGHILTFCIAPEKFVIMAVLSLAPESLFSRVLTIVSMIFLLSLDFCGVAALIVGAVNHTLPAALGVGYGVTAVGGVFLLLVVLWDQCKCCR